MNLQNMLMTHLYFGDPSPEFSFTLAETLAENGADVLEIGIPYTDPVCDGEIFQRSCARALCSVTSPYDVLEGVGKLSKTLKVPIYLTSYYGPIFKIGVLKFVKMAKEAGIVGLIVPDLLLEEQSELSAACKLYGLSLVQFATVYSTKERLKKIISASNDFIYCTALPGVTGDKIQKDKLLRSLKLLKSLTKKKIYVGFGIGSQKDTKEIIDMGADGVIVGSAIARIYESHINNPTSTLQKVGAFVKSLKGVTI